MAKYKFKLKIVKEYLEETTGYELLAREHNIPDTFLAFLEQILKLKIPTLFMQR